MTKKNIMIFSVLVAISLIAGGIYYFGIKRKTLKSLFGKDDEKPGTGEYEGTERVEVGSMTWGLGHDNFPLREGSYGKKVKVVQEWLNSNCSAKLPKLKADGKFGKNTVDKSIECGRGAKISKSDFEFMAKI